MFDFCRVAQTAAVRTRPANISCQLIGRNAGKPVGEGREDRGRGRGGWSRGKGLFGSSPGPSYGSFECGQALKHRVFRIRAALFVAGLDL